MLKCEDYGGKEGTERTMRGNKESPASRILVQPAPLICSKILWCSKGEEYKEASDVLCMEGEISDRK